MLLLYSEGELTVIYCMLYTPYVFFSFFRLPAKELCQRQLLGEMPGAGTAVHVQNAEANSGPSKSYT